MACSYEGVVTSCQRTMEPFAARIGSMGIDGNLTRKQFLGALVATAAAPSLALGQEQTERQATGAISADDLKIGDKLAGIELTEPHRKLAVNGVRTNVRNFASIRKLEMPNDVEPLMVFTPQGRQPKESKAVSLRPTPAGSLRRPKDEDDLAFLSARELGHLVRTKQVSPVELTELYLHRLDRYGDTLKCVITLTPELARKQAKQAEDDVMRGKVRSPLHGVPYGIKDLFAVKGYRTTWGAEAFENQTIDHDAAAVERLTEAGAICLAKLSCGALAYDDVWFGGQTKNPWNLRQGSSGSSAGSACSTAAGLVGFSIGTETLGSIISPSNRCRVSGLRPTYGRVSRYGAMTLTWTMDKVGPICRAAEDCGLVLGLIKGKDPRDLASVDRPYHWRPTLDLSKLKIGILYGEKDDLKDRSVIERADWARSLEKMGAKLQPVKFTTPAEGIWSLLVAEGTAFFDEISRTAGIDTIGKVWPPEFLAARYLPAVEYINAHRARALMAKTFEEQWGDLDLIVTDHFWDDVFTICNGTGHPQAIIPWGLDAKNEPRSVSVVGRLYDEPRIAAVASMIQRTASYHLNRPDTSQW